MIANVIKQENVGFLKSRFQLFQGMLYLTDERLILQARPVAEASFSFFGKNKQQKELGFDIARHEIKNVAKGKHGINKNVLEITDNSGNVWRMIVNNYEEWESDILHRA